MPSGGWSREAGLQLLPPNPSLRSTPLAIGHTLVDTRNLVLVTPLLCGEYDVDPVVGGLERVRWEGAAYPVYAIWSVHPVAQRVQRAIVDTGQSEGIQVVPKTAIAEV